MKIVAWFIALCMVILGVGWWIQREKNIESSRTDELLQTWSEDNIANNVQDISETTSTTYPDTNIVVSEPNIEPTKVDITTPPSVSLEVPFYVQAPDNKRTLPWTETCEEASLVLAAYYIKWTQLTKDQFKKDMLSLIDVEKKLFNTYIDTNILQLEELYNAYYNDGTTKIIDNPTIQQIKEELAQWHIIVAPFAGRELNNPHFSGNGPRYHMLVIRWYDDTYFYTNDVGTVHGENFAYTYDIIIHAMHDLTDGDISDGAKRMLVISK